MNFTLCLQMQMAKFSHYDKVKEMPAGVSKGHKWSRVLKSHLVVLLGYLREGSSLANLGESEPLACL